MQGTRRERSDKHNSLWAAINKCHVPDSPFSTVLFIFLFFRNISIFFLLIWVKKRDVHGNCFFSLDTDHLFPLFLDMSMLRSSVARSLRAVNSRQVAALPRLAISSSVNRLSSPCLAPFLSQSHLSLRQFHLSAPIYGSGESDPELSSRLGQEISYEKEAASSFANESSGGEPEFLSDFIKQGLWNIEDQAGSDEISLTREFGNEHIRILFSIGDIDTTEEEENTTEELEARAFPVRCAITISKVSTL